MAYETLIQPVVERGRRAPEQVVFMVIHENGMQERVSAGQFHQDALVYAQKLNALGVRAGDLVVLVLRHSRELLSAFWGMLYLGAIPSIFPFLTEKLDPVVYRERVRTLVVQSQARALITFPDGKHDFCAILSGLDCLVLATDELRQTETDRSSLLFLSETSPDKIAFLQHSSGTTGLQKGVALTHHAVLGQIEAYGRAIGLGPADVVVSWLPLYHDMGLIAGFIMPIVAGLPLVLLSPFQWVRDPKSLLWAIHEHKGTLCWLPNFAYNHMARTIRQRDLEGLDLHGWRMSINCSEPVRHESHQLFLQRFAPHGFRANALATCYAMAENTFAVTQSPPLQPPHVDWVDLRMLQEEGRAISVASEVAGAISVVSCGFPIVGTEVAIANEDRKFLPARQVGEILIRSDYMLREYYHRPDITRDAFFDGWYCTGDMGYLANGQLYVSGRKKDLIIVGGKNIYPQDLEALTNGVPGIYPGRVVAFGILDQRLGTEEIVLICELKKPVHNDARKQIESELRRLAVQRLDVTLGDVCLIEQRWLLKTSSGKIARSANRARYIAQFRQ
jgi:fatty-acyl-CoA synthase